MRRTHHITSSRQTGGRFHGGYTQRRSFSTLIFSPVVGSEQGGVRPVLIVQNEIGNRHSPTVIAAAITSRLDKTRLPTHINIRAADTGLAKTAWCCWSRSVRWISTACGARRQIPAADQKRVDRGWT